MSSSSASPSNCQGRRHATPWLRVMKRQRHKAPCQDALLHLCNSQTHITAHILNCIKVFNPWASKDAYAASQDATFNSRTTQYMRRQIMVILEEPYRDLSFCFFFYFLFCKSLYQEAKSCNLYPGFCRLHSKFNSGAKGLIKLLDDIRCCTQSYIREQFIYPRIKKCQSSITVQIIYSPCNILLPH
jgi:hypothetical protein